MEHFLNEKQWYEKNFCRSRQWETPFPPTKDRRLNGWSLVYLLLLKSVNSNFTLAVHSPKLNQVKTHFLSHLGEKKRKNMARPRFEPMISGSKVDHANHYSIGHLFEIQQIYLCYIHCDETKSESWPDKVLVSVLPE